MDGLRWVGWRSMGALVLLLSVGSGCGDDGPSPAPDSGVSPDGEVPGDACDVANGGCDALTSCDDSSGAVVCGGCPSGYGRPGGPCGRHQI